MELLKMEHISFAENDTLSVHYLQVHESKLGTKWWPKNVLLLFFEQGTAAPYIANYTLAFCYTFIFYENRGMVWIIVEISWYARKASGHHRNE